MASTAKQVSPPPVKRQRVASPREACRDTLTVYSWNVNGIAPFIQRPITSFFKYGDGNDGSGRRADQTTASLRQFLRHHDWPTLLLLQEVKISPEDSSTITAVEKAVRRPQHDTDPTDSDYVAHFCLPSDKYNARGFGRKVYGVCSIILKDFFDRFVDTVRPVSWDQEGRFLIIKTKASGQIPRLAIINVYAVNGTDNTYKDPDTGEPAGTRHDRKLKVHALLQAECRELEAEGFHCIIGGDINIARAVIDGFPNLRTSPKQHCINRADFEARFFATSGKHNGQESADRHSTFAQPAAPGLGMIDTFRHLHPEKRGHTYYPRTREFGKSCDRVDMILISKTLKRSLESAGMHETPADRGSSDHVPLYARLDFERSVEDPERRC